MILIISDVGDLHADAVQDKLSQSPNRVCRLNLDVQSLRSTIITFEDENWTISQRGSGTAFTTGDVSVVWMRRGFVELLLEETENRTPDFLIWKNEWNKTLLGLYMSLQDLPWLCPLRDSYRAENKYLQRKIASKHGFLVPKQLTSNDRDRLINFAASCPTGVVLKLMNQDFYKVEGEFQGIYVNKLSATDLGDFADNDENPIVLQEYVEKQFEVRYTVVGAEHFPCRIESQRSIRASVDWRRYDLANTPHYTTDAPADIRSRVASFLGELNLNYGALDFVVQPSGEWVFLEVNPMGQWLWIEDLTGMGISDSIARWLRDHDSERR